MKTGTLPRLSMAVVLLVLWSSLGGQGLVLKEKPDEPDMVLDSLQLIPYKLSAITDAFNKSNILIAESGNMQLSDVLMEAYKGEADILFAEVDQFLGDSITHSLEGLVLRELSQIEQRSEYFQGELRRFQDRILGESKTIRNALAKLLLDQKRWKLTRDYYANGEFIEERLLRIDRLVFGLDSVHSLLQLDLGQLVRQQDRVSDKIFELEQVKDAVKDQKEHLGEQLFRRDAAGLFSGLSHLGDPGLLKKHSTQMKKEFRTDLAVLKSDFLASIVFLFFLSLGFLAFFVWYKRHYNSQLSVQKSELSKMQLALISSPLVTAFFIFVIMIRFIHHDLPRSFAAFNLLLMMLPLMILVVRLFGRHVRQWILLLVILFSLTLLYDLYYFPDILQRLFLLGFSVLGLVLFLWLYRKKPLEGLFSSERIYRIFRIILTGFSVLLFISIIANLIGASSLAEFFTLLPIQIAILAVVIQVIIKVLDTMIFLLLASNYLQKFNVIRDGFQVIYKKMAGLADILLWFFFLSAALRIFRIRDAVFEWGRGVFTNGIKIGEVDITLGNILIFVFVIWLSIMITRMLSQILEKDVFTRVKTGKGVPSTIILLMKIVLISGGFFFAAKAAGMALTNLSIVLGAFSVGIGFGLQNIFNNMVSGLILAFERPIKVGDIVQVGELTGSVLSIGLRSSTVRSFDGAEVIVPNGNLISDQMINWTKSDSNRRMDIRIGVAYGTNPETVLAIMEELAQGHKMVDKTPPPRAYFIGFGDSSLDFRLLAWTILDYRLETESELNVALNQALKKAGIEIPFPQRDLHIRSDSTKG